MFLADVLGEETGDVNPPIGLPASSIFKDVFLKSNQSRGLPYLSHLLFKFCKFSLLLTSGTLGGKFMELI